MAEQPTLYGLTREQEERKELLLRDVRTPLERICAGLLSREGYSCALVGILAALWAEPGYWFVWFTLGLILFAARSARVRFDHLPMRLPQSHAGPDYNSPAPGGGFKPSSGMFYIGNDALEGNQELWIAREDILTHMLVLGTTGAGKTETLVSLCFNYLAVGSGLIYVDPKAAPRLAAQIWTMARMLGREDDFLCINYMADKVGRESRLKHRHMRTPLRQSNTQNPFAVGDANSLTQLLFALMPSDEKSGSSIFSNNAQTLISGLLFVLVERRDMGLEALSIETIRSYLMDIPKIDALARESMYSETATLALQAGLSTVGWDKSKDLAHQPKSFPEQYSYARAYFGRALSLLVDLYGRIFRATQGEVDAVDVITNRRIFVTLIPSMDKDPKELKSLGQICLASVRNACSVGLGEKVQGRLGDVLGALPTEARVPFGIVVDEYAAIETPGFEILLTQGRGLGMAVIVASQDFSGIRRASEAAAEQIVSNCKTKLFMTTEDPRQTAELVQKLAGTGYVLKSSGFSVDRARGGTQYADNCAVNAESMQRVDFRDLQKQVEGDVTISFKGEIIRGRTFFANPPLKERQQVRLNYQLQCPAPDVDRLEARFGEAKELLCAFLGRFEESLRLSEEDSSQCLAQGGSAPRDDWAERDPLIFVEENVDSHSVLGRLGLRMRRGRAFLAASDLAIVAFCSAGARGVHEEESESEAYALYDVSYADEQVLTQGACGDLPREEAGRPADGKAPISHAMDSCSTAKDGFSTLVQALRDQKKRSGKAVAKKA